MSATISTNSRAFLGRLRLEAVDIAASDQLLAAIDQATENAQRAHDAGRCHESEWSCSSCEVAR